MSLSSIKMVGAFTIFMFIKIMRLKIHPFLNITKTEHKFNTKDF